MSRLGMSVGITTLGAMLYFPLAEVVKMAFRHPFISSIILGVMSLIVLADDVFDFAKIDATAPFRMTQDEIAEQYEPFYCESSYCSYRGGMKVVFEDGSAQAVTYPATRFLYRDFENNEDFYRYALTRAGFDYQEPNYADMNMIIWDNIDGARVTLTSNNSMKPDKMMVER